MKTERRHELQTNVLANWLGHKIERVRPFSKVLLGGVAVVAVVAVAATYIANQQSARSSAGWADFYRAFAEQNPDRLRSVAEDHSGTLPALWALQAEGDLELSRGIRALYISRDEAKEALANAIQIYEQVENGARGQPMLLARAQFGRAQAHEASNELDEARKQYQKIIDNGGDPAVARAAKLRLDELEDSDTVKWYNWFARQKPRPPPTMPGGPGGAPGVPGGPTGFDLPALPDDLGELPDRPDLSFPASVTDPAEDGPTRPQGDEAPDDATTPTDASDADTPQPSE